MNLPIAGQLYEPPRRGYERFFDCVHCGLCLPKCPTYALLGEENDSPRGRIYLMRGLTERRIQPSERVVRHLDRCLDCRACETACPSGVRYGSLLEAARTALRTVPGRRPARWADRVEEHLIYRVFPDRTRLRRWIRFARLADAIGLRQFLRTSDLVSRVTPGLNRMDLLLPPIQDEVEEIASVTQPRGTKRARVAFFLGCVGEAVYPQINRATLRVLLANGCEVLCPAGQVCCGAIHHHGGRLADARALVRCNVRVFEDLAAHVGGLDAVVTNAAGCGAMLKAAGELLADDAEYAARAASFASRVRDISEFLMSLPLRRPGRALGRRVTYHDPCHLAHAQGVRRQPRELLRSVPGLELVEMAESDVCCGAAGTYYLTQPELADELARRKLANVDRLSGVRTIATGNVGCLMQLAMHIRRSGRSYGAVHPVELLDEAYGGG